MDVRADELEDLIQNADLIMDATDNFDTRLLINDMSQKYRIPWIYGGVELWYHLYIPAWGYPLSELFTWRGTARWRYLRYIGDYTPGCADGNGEPDSRSDEAS